MVKGRGGRPGGKRGAKKATLDARTIIIIIIVAVLIIAALVYLIGFGGLDQILKGVGEDQAGQSVSDGEKDSGNTSSDSTGIISGEAIGTANSFRYGSVLGGKSDFTLPSQLDGRCLEVHFVNIGQGDAIVIMLPDGKIFIIDAGSGSTASPRKAVKEKYLAYLSDDLDVDEIDYFVITHPDTDHYNMASRVFDKYVVRNAFYNNYKDPDKKKTYTNFLTNKVEKEPNIVIHPVNEEYFYMRIEDETYGYAFDIYAPGDTGFSGAESKWNSMSIMCVLSYGGRKVMFTGDAEVQTEAWFMETVGGIELDVDILKVGHHGSRSCTSTAFVEFIKPEYAVISCDDGDAYGHPHQETMVTLNTYGVATYRTNRHGNIVLYMDEDGDFMFLPQYASTVENNSKNRDPLEIILEPAA